MDANGLVSATGIGASVLRACDQRNGLHCATAAVRVREPVKLAFRPGPVATAVGNRLTLVLAVLDADGALFDACGSLDMRWSLVPERVFSVDEAAVVGPQVLADAGGCLALVLDARKAGESRVTATWLHLSATCVWAAPSSTAPSPPLPPPPPTFTLPLPIL